MQLLQTPSEMRPDEPAPQLELESLTRLTNFGVKLGLPIDEAEDLATELWLEIWERYPEKGAEERFTIACAAMRLRLIDYRASTARIFAKRLDMAITRAKEKRTMLQWREHGVRVVGLPSQQGRIAMRLSQKASIDAQFRDFLYWPEGLGGSDPRSFETEPIVVRFLEWLDAPAERSLIIFMLADAVVDRPQAVAGGKEPVAPAQPDPVNIRGMWESIGSLPTAAMRGVLLLSMDEGMLRAMRSNFREELAKVIQGWLPPPPLETIELPADDAVIAQGLAREEVAEKGRAQTIARLQVVRSRARGLVQKALRSLVDETMPPYPLQGGS